MVHIPHFDPHAVQIVGQILRHFFGEGGNKHSFFFLHPQVDFGKQIVDLALYRLDDDLRVNEAGGADHLFGDVYTVFPFKLGGSGRHIDHLVDFRVKLVEVERPVVKGRRQPESVVDQRLFPSPIPKIHPPYLGDCHMGFVDEHQKIVPEVVEEGIGCAAGLSPGKDAGIVFDALAKADFLQHLDVVFGALLNPLGF